MKEDYIKILTEDPKMANPLYAEGFNEGMAQASKLAEDAGLDLAARKEFSLVYDWVLNRQKELWAANAKK